MALPVSPPPKSEDVAVHGWSGITVRIAWTLLSAGVKIRPQVLDAARRHVLFHLAPGTPLPAAEDRAAHLTRQFIASARHKQRADKWPADAEMPLTERWARAIDHLKDRASRAVFRMHYGDNRSLAYVENKLQVDRLTVDAARAGLREVLRRAARQDGLPLDNWEPERLDRVLSRLASWAPDHCPPMYDVVNGAHHAHVRACPRCNRMLRLVNAGVLEVDDLQPPTLRARPRGSVELLVLHFHPDGRCHRTRLQEALPVDSHTLGEDLLLVHATDTADLHDVLAMAAELGRPVRHHLRAARVSGDGAWTALGPIGPAVELGLADVRSRAWGTVDGYGNLPEPLPKPPSARGAWFATAGLAAAALFSIWLAAAPATGATPPETVRFVPSGQGTWAAFDVPEDHHVALVGALGGGLETVLAGDTILEKSRVAVGDGTYRAHVPGKAALLVSSSEALDLASLLEGAESAVSPLDALHAGLKRSHPDARVFVSR